MASTKGLMTMNKLMKKMRLNFYEIVLLLLPMIFIKTPYFLFVTYFCLVLCSLVAYQRNKKNGILVDLMMMLMEDHIDKDKQSACIKIRSKGSKP